MNTYIIISIGVVVSAFLFRKYRKQAVEIYTIIEFIHAKTARSLQAPRGLKSFLKNLTLPDQTMKKQRMTLARIEMETAENK
ncbi:hypothetical protein [Priestia megaterium]|uniref:hypothetical protein n=1 Tax=Priestia megaterium TaxID=1404 RepID=UPI001F104368|nr:hypothetical protein [Priestia megaterium]